MNAKQEKVLEKLLLQLCEADRVGLTEILSLRAAGQRMTIDEAFDFVGSQMVKEASKHVPCDD